MHSVVLLSVHFIDCPKPKLHFTGFSEDWLLFAEPESQLVFPGPRSPFWALLCYLWLWEAKPLSCLLPSGLVVSGNPTRGSVPRCKRCGLSKSPASGMSVAALSCFPKSRTGSSFNFFAFLVYFRTSQKHAVLLCFIEISLLVFLYCLLGTWFLFSGRVGVSQGNMILRQKRATGANITSMLQKESRVQCLRDVQRRHFVIWKAQKLMSHFFQIEAFPKGNCQDN